MSLAQADRPIPDVLAFFAGFGIEVGLLVPTRTGLDKGIMDAHASLRDYLSERGIHDFASQGQGTSHKRLVPANIVTTNGVYATKASLYRPVTKSGDPRIWVYGLPNFASPLNVMAVVADGPGLVLVNASDPILLKSGHDPSSPLGKTLARLSPGISSVAQELLDRLRDVGRQGFIQTRRPGPTGVGFTLESLLGIKANPRKAPDYKGIEIKAGRMSGRGRASVRTSLFSMAPDWSNSKYSALQLLRTYGRPSASGRRQIYCSLGPSPNPSFGFYLNVDDSEEVLRSRKGRPFSARAETDEDILQWGLPDLRNALVAKHHETFWVKARARSAGRSEEFHYYEVEHTHGPLPSYLAPLIESGHVELDFTLSLKKTAAGRETARDHGYLFKMWARDRHLLFAPARKYPLT